MFPNRRGAEGAGYRVGRLIGSGMSRFRTVRREPGRLAEPSSAIPPPQTTSSPLCQLRSNSGRQYGHVTALLGVGLDLPLVRPLLRGLAGPLAAEIALVGLAVAPILSPGGLQDPLQVSSAAVGVASPLIHAALAPLVGPLVVEVALASAAIGLILVARISLVSARKPKTAPVELTARRAEPRFLPALPHRLTAAG